MCCVTFLNHQISTVKKLTLDIVDFRQDSEVPGIDNNDLESIKSQLIFCVFLLFLFAAIISLAFGYKFGV